MAPEAMRDTIDTAAAREALHDVEGAARPASAAWLYLSECEMAPSNLRAAVTAGTESLGNSPRRAKAGARLLALAGIKAKDASA